MKKYPTLRRWLTPILPILSILVGGFIVTHEYMRRDRLKNEVKQAQSEFDRLTKLLPKGRQPAKHDDDDHDHHD